MANTDNAFSFRFVRSAYGDTSPPVAKHVASAEFEIGDPLEIDADGELAMAGTTNAVIGFAAEPASTNDNLHYVIARVGDVWKAQGVSGWAVDAEDIGQRAGIAGSTSGVLEVDDDGDGGFIVDGLADEPDNEWGSNAVLNLRIAKVQTTDV